MLDGITFLRRSPGKSSESSSSNSSFSTGSYGKAGLRIFAIVFGSSYKASFTQAEFIPLCVLE